MEQREAYTITYAVLGMLARWGPMSGYDVKRYFDQGLGYIWSATHSQIYKELRRLADLGWAEMEREEQESRPDRKVYRMTPAGREGLARWLGQPAEMLQLHDELLLKVVFGTFAPPGALAATVRASIAAHERRLAQFQEEARLHGDPTQPETWQGYPRPEGVTDPYIGLTTRLAIAFEEMYLRWLRETLALIAPNEPPHQP
ncbi:MAG TPA: PadR family transcriptional regulator [Ktedonobacterales bacterium]|jgi:PadR family transcriptional regulator AphA